MRDLTSFLYSNVDECKHSCGTKTIESEKRGPISQSSIFDQLQNFICFIRTVTIFVWAQYTNGQWNPLLFPMNEAVRAIARVSVSQYASIRRFAPPKRHERTDLFRSFLNFFEIP